MTHRSTSSASEDMYLSDIITGAHGDKYQKDLAMVIFERATREGLNFRLGYEMAIADKFDDVAFFNKEKDEWILIQAKHADISKGKPPPLKYEMLFPSDEATREKGDFSLFKYLKSYMTVQENIKERKNIVFFTNRDLQVNSLEQSVRVEPRSVHKILQFDHASHVGLKATDVLTKELINFVNREFYLLRDSIVKLFKEGIVDQTIKYFKTPVANILAKTNTSVGFSNSFTSDTCQMLASLSCIIDIQSAQLSLDKCKDLFTGKSRNKKLPLYANEETIQQFFKDLILSVQQPDDLHHIVDQDLRSWMRTWIRPDYLTRLEEPQLKMCTASLEYYFNNKQSPVKKTDEKGYYKEFLQLKDGQEVFASFEKDLDKQKHNLSMFTQNDASGYYIHRQLQYMESRRALVNMELSEEITNCYGNTDEQSDIHVNNKDTFVQMSISDDQFVCELSSKFNNQKFLLLTAEPGMGKTTILEFIALAAQRNRDDCVYLFNLNVFHHALAQVEAYNSFDKLLSVLATVLSDANFNRLRETIKRNDNRKKYFIVFDAFDEVLSQNRKKVLKIFREMLNVTNIQILVSTRRTVKNLLENEFNVTAMSLMPFSNEDQIDFLSRFWKVQDEDKYRFLKYVKHLFKSFHSDVNRALCEFTGLPLMLKMLADVYTENFKTYLSLEQSNLEEFMPKEILSTIDLYEQFVQKCFTNKMLKKVINLLPDFDEEYEPMYDKFILEHQLLAIKLLQIKILEIVFTEKPLAKIFNAFEKRIIDGTERSPLIEVVENISRFIHLSYAEFLVAKFLYVNIDKYEAQIFGPDSKAELFDGYPMIRIFFFTMIEAQFSSEHLTILDKHYTINNRLALWACEVYGQKTVEFLLRTVSDTTIYNRVLNVAAQHNYFNICTYLLNNHPVTVDFIHNGKTPIYAAAEEGHFDVVKLLIEESVNVNAKQNNGWTPLHIAANKGFIKIVKILVDNLADIEAKNNNDCTALLYAAQEGHYDVVKFLIDHLGNVNAKSREGRTPIFVAAQFGHLSIVELLIRSSVDVNLKFKTGATPLFIASQFGHVEIVKHLVNHSANVNEKDINGWVPLHLAANNNRWEVSKILIDGSANVNSKNNNGWTPLHLAALTESPEVAKILIDNNADIEVKSDDGTTPFHSACLNGSSKVVKILIDKIKHVHEKSGNGLTPLHLAARYGHTEIVEILINYSGNVNAENDNKSTPLHTAARNGHSEVVKILINHYGDVNAKDIDGLTPLHQAAQNDHFKIVKILIEHSGNVNAKCNEDYTPLHLAAEKGHWKVVKILVNHSEHVIDAKCRTGSTPLHLAALHGHSDVVKILIEHSAASVNAKKHEGSIPLHMAAETNQSAVAKILLDHSGDINAKCIDGWTPLHMAAQNGHAEIMQLFIDHCGNVNQEDFTGWTPLHLAAQSNHSEVAKILINHSAKVNAVKHDGWMPIHLAAQHGRLEVLKILIEHSGDVNARHTDGWTPLHLAAMSGHTEIVKTLIDHSGNINAENNAGVTPLSVATQNGHSDIVDILTEHFLTLSLQRSHIEDSAC